MNENNEFKIAGELYENEEYEKAFQIYTKLANSGSVESQVFIGWMYQNGLGVNKNDNEAFAWYEMAAKLGSAEGQFYLAKSYSRRGEFSKAKNWYEVSAKKHYSPALYRLGWIYETGRDVKPDRNKALLYYRQAADLGHVFAQKNIGLLLIKKYFGFRGFFYLMKSIISTINIAAKDPGSEKLRD